MSSCVDTSKVVESNEVVTVVNWNGFVAVENKLKGGLDVVGEKVNVKVEDNWSDEIVFGDDILSDEEIGEDVVVPMERTNEF